MKHIYLVIVLFFLSISVQAQITKAEAEGVKEMEIGKDYQKEDILKVAIASKQILLVEPNRPEQIFAKITKKKYTTILTYTQSGEAIELHAYCYSNKKFEKIKTHHYIFSNGTVNPGDSYEGRIKRTKNGLKMEETNRKKTKLKTYEFGNKYMEFGEHLDQDTPW